MSSDVKPEEVVAWLEGQIELSRALMERKHVTEGVAATTVRMLQAAVDLIKERG